MTDAAATLEQTSPLSDAEYKRRIRAWTMYDWANSAFATTILAAVLPVYYSQVAGATLPSAARATAYWSAGLSIALLLTAVLSPILGTVSDIMRGKKRLLSLFLAVGALATALMVLIDTGDWLLASILFIIGRVGFSGSIVFYDSLLPHIARPEDQDAVSTRGYAWGYLGGGLLLAINILMISVLPGTWGPRLSFLSVAIWWVVFSIPLLRVVPEPPAATAALGPGQTVLSASFKRLRQTFGHLRRYRELFKFLVAFLIYNDGIGTIIGVAAIYGAELGFGSVELIMAILLVQFVGIPFSLVFGRLPTAREKRRPFFLAFVLFNVAALPLTGVLGARLLPSHVVGAPPPDLPATETAVDEGLYAATGDAVNFEGEWERTVVAADAVGEDEPLTYLQAATPGAAYSLRFHGRQTALTYRVGPEEGIWQVLLDGEPLLEDGEAVTIDAYSATTRYGVSRTLPPVESGEHTVTVVNSGERNAQSEGTTINVAQVEVLPLFPESNLGLVIGLLLLVQLVGLALAFFLGPALFTGLADALNTKRTIFLALAVYGVIATWGFFLNSVIEFWFLAWLVAVVQGGSQGLSRSLYASLSPASKSGEFFGLFSIMEKFASFLGPLLFAAAVALFDSSRPAVLSLVLFFVIGGFLLTRVDVERGRAIAREEDEALWAAGSAEG
ncbi:MAG: MFS transporter [Chloroflexota bacterium]